MISSYPPSYALMVTFDVDGSLDVSLNIHGLQVCHSDTSQSIPWQALDECPQTFEVVFGWSMARTMARPIKFWACRKNTKWRTRKQEERACPINPSMRQLLEFLRRGKVISDKYNQTWRENKIMASVVCSNSTSQSFVFGIPQYISISEQLYSQAWKTNY